MKRLMTTIAVLALGTLAFAMGTKEGMGAAEAAAALDAKTAASGYAQSDVDAAKAAFDAMVAAGIEPRAALELLEEAVDEGLVAADLAALASLASTSGAATPRRLERELNALVDRLAPETEDDDLDDLDDEDDEDDDDEVDDEDGEDDDDDEDDDADEDD